MSCGRQQVGSDLGKAVAANRLPAAFCKLRRERRLQEGHLGLQLGEEEAQIWFIPLPKGKHSEETPFTSW